MNSEVPATIFNPPQAQGPPSIKAGSNDGASQKGLSNVENVASIVAHKKRSRKPMFQSEKDDVARNGVSETDKTINIISVN